MNQSKPFVIIKTQGVFMQPDHLSFVDWAFKATISGAFVYLVSILSGIKNSVDVLNIHMATMFERVAHHEKRIERLEIKSEEN